MCIVYPLNMKLDSYIFRVSACSRRDCKNATAFFTSSPLGGVPGSSSISWRGRIQGAQGPPFLVQLLQQLHNQGLCQLLMTDIWAQRFTLHLTLFLFLSSWEGDIRGKAQGPFLGSKLPNSTVEIGPKGKWKQISSTIQADLTTSQELLGYLKTQKRSTLELQ